MCIIIIMFIIVNIEVVAIVVVVVVVSFRGRALSTTRVKTGPNSLGWILV